MRGDGQAASAIHRPGTFAGYTSDAVRGMASRNVAHQGGTTTAAFWQGERRQPQAWRLELRVYSAFRLTSSPDAFFIEETLRALVARR